MMSAKKVTREDIKEGMQSNTVVNTRTNTRTIFLHISSNGGANQTYISNTLNAQGWLKADGEGHYRGMRCLYYRTIEFIGGDEEHFCRSAYVLRKAALDTLRKNPEELGNDAEVHIVISRAIDYFTFVDEEKKEKETPKKKTSKKGSPMKSLKESTNMLSLTATKGDNDSESNEDSDKESEVESDEEDYNDESVTSEKKVPNKKGNKTKSNKKKDK